MDILSSVLVTISCKIHKNVFIRVTEMQFFYVPPILLPQESLLNLQAKDNDKNESRSCMLPPCCIEMVIVMSVFDVFWKGEEMQDTPGFQPHVLELLTRPNSLSDTGVFSLTIIFFLFSYWAPTLSHD